MDHSHSSDPAIYPPLLPPPVPAPSDCMVDLYHDSLGVGPLDRNLLHNSFPLCPGQEDMASEYRWSLWRSESVAPQCYGDWSYHWYIHPQHTRSNSITHAAINFQKGGYGWHILSRNSVCIISPIHLGIYQLTISSSSIIAATLVRIKTDYDLETEDLPYSSARKSLILCIVPLIGIIVACLPIIPPALQRLFGTNRFSSLSEGATTYGYTHSGYYKTTVLSGTQMEEPEIPLVSVDRPPMAKKLSEWCQGQIKITSDWEIHSTRNSARLDKDSIRRAWVWYYRLRIMIYEYYFKSGCARYYPAPSCELQC